MAYALRQKGHSPYLHTRRQTIWPRGLARLHQSIAPTRQST